MYKVHTYITACIHTCATCEVHSCYELINTSMHVYIVRELVHTLVCSEYLPVYVVHACAISHAIIVFKLNQAVP